MYQLRGKLSIVMPAYNEEALIYNSIMQTLSIVERFAPDLEIIAVNDGSKDKTKQEIERAIRDDAKQPHPVVPGMRVSGTRIKLVTSNKNRGKGNAIISGISQAEGDYIAFVDADLELNPAQLEGYLKKMQESGSDVVIGCKFHKDSELHGLKVFKAEAVKPVAHLVRTSGFAYDIELLVAVHRRGFKIEQMPVKVVYVRDKNTRRIGMSDIVKAFRDTWAIFYRVYFKHYYDEPSE